MANAKPKPEKSKSSNMERRNRKAWKLRPCGRRHAPGTHDTCGL
jgi:hypothetical protein